jgi:hypothetical protein
VEPGSDAVESSGVIDGEDLVSVHVIVVKVVAFDNVVPLGVSGIDSCEVGKGGV